jgi:lipopolysaccharide export system ATP-binding protein
MKTAPHTLEVDSVQLEFGLRNILSDVHIKCETGKITGLLGRNGQGKTCLMRIIYGDLDVASRSVRFDNIPVPEAFKRPDLLLYLPQFHFIPGSLTLKRVLSDFNLDFGELEKRFPEFRSRYRSGIRHLSGGERRLIHIYIITRSTSRFAMLDEPFSHLMPLQVEKVKEMLLEEKVNKGLLITDHLYRDIIDLSDRLYVLANAKTHLTKKIEDIETLGYARL